ncbi:hypothetical protein CFP56_041492 [Quercus suber]|uniref:DUF4283 domain-containing protein n=1 Tax=Quercus suber TaxID=58331 RepID=A0AAW0LJB0_QUESU
MEAGPILVGKFYTKRWVNLESVARILKLAWKTKKNFEVSDLGENRALFLFKTMDDLDKGVVLDSNSWTAHDEPDQGNRNENQGNVGVGGENGRGRQRLMYGLMDHDEKDCLQWIRSKESLRLEEKQFGVWLRATPERSQKAQLIKVMRNGGRREDGDVDKTGDRMVSIPRKSM